MIKKYKKIVALSLCLMVSGMASTAHAWSFKETVDRVLNRVLGRGSQAGENAFRGLLLFCALGSFCEGKRDSKKLALASLIAAFVYPPLLRKLVEAKNKQRESTIVGIHLPALETMPIISTQDTPNNVVTTDATLKAIEAQRREIEKYERSNEKPSNIQNNVA
jgi:hypothetical protein